MQTFTLTPQQNAIGYIKGHVYVKLFSYYTATVRNLQEFITLLEREAPNPQDVEIVEISNNIDQDFVNGVKSIIKQYKSKDDEKPTTIKFRDTKNKKTKTRANNTLYRAVKWQDRRDGHDAIKSITVSYKRVVNIHDTWGGKIYDRFYTCTSIITFASGVKEKVTFKCESMSSFKYETIQKMKVIKDYDFDNKTIK